MSLVWIDPESRENRKPEAALPLFPPCTSEPEGVRREATMVADGVARKTYEPSANFEQARARNSDPETSHAAARSIVNLGPVRNAVIRLLKAFPSGLTDEQLIETYREAQKASPQNFWNATDSGIRTRRSELVRMGFVVEAGTGKTASGRACTIWRLA